MRGSTPAAAGRALRDVLQLALSTVTPDVAAQQTESLETKLSLMTQLARSGGAALTLSIRHTCVAIHDRTRASRDAWEARTSGYMCSLEDADGHEILAYHWHPEARSHVTTPHLHLGAGAGALRAELTKAHLATGPVSPTVLLALAIESFGARPRRADWSVVLERSREALEQT